LGTDQETTQGEQKTTIMLNINEFSWVLILNDDEGTTEKE